MRSLHRSDLALNWGASQMEPGCCSLPLRPLRILMIATEAPPVCSGIARIVGYLCDGLRSRGHQVDLLAYPQVGRLVLGEVRLSSLFLHWPRLLRRICSYDVVHIHGVTPTMSDISLFFMQLFRLRLPVIYTHHVDLDFSGLPWLSQAYNTLHHYLCRRANVVVAATGDTLNLLRRYNAGYIIPFGIDLTRFEASVRRDRGFTVLFAGQFRPWKGVEILLKALADVPDARLLLAGQGPCESVYRDLAATLHLEVEFHIGVSDSELSLLYQRAHVVITPSLSRLEAFGLTLLEGMAAGCVPIASALPGVREVVEPVGLLFPPGNVAYLTGILQRLRADPLLLAAMGERARSYAQNFGQEQTIQAYEQLFASLVATQEDRGV